MGFDFDCAVIGGGPGGLVSALYLKRFKRDVILINAGKPRAAWIPETHNLLGFPKGISGRRLILKLNRQVAELAVPRILGDAKVHVERSGFQVETPDGPIRARKVILATGMEDIQPGIENLAALRDAGLLRYCPVCDGYDFQKERLAVLAADDHGVQKALWISTFSRDLHLVLPPGFQLSARRRKQLSEIGARFYCGSLSRIVAASDNGSLRIHVTGYRPIQARAAYVVLGSSVRDSAFRHLRKLRRSNDGFIIATTEQRTSIPGLFAVGDCVNLLGQISVAAGQAAVAATTIHNDLL